MQRLDKPENIDPRLRNGESNRDVLARNLPSGGLASSGLFDLGSCHCFYANLYLEMYRLQ